MKKLAAKRKKQCFATLKLFLEPSDERIEMHAKWFTKAYEAWKKRQGKR